jgi:5'-3' exonuclease
MGIPSFYKHIIESITGVTAKTRAVPPEFFGLDLNCAIYHCVRHVQRTTPYTPETSAKWEADLIKYVITYIQKLRAIVRPTKTLYIAVDGVAPMAKIKQQRMRRFKSAVNAETESRLKADAEGRPYIPEPRWDTNAITPGTQFMTNLATALRSYAASDPCIYVSPADIAGEGEQKLMDAIRQTKPADAVIYGLDADLIILALWTSHTQATRIDLFREDTEFSGAVKENIYGDEEFVYMDCGRLADAIYTNYVPVGSVSKQDFIHDFVGLMSMLGNDFVPHGMGLKIRAGGIPLLLEQYMTLPRPIVQCIEGEWKYNPLAIQAYFEWLMIQEPILMLDAIKKKRSARIGATASKDPAEQALARYNDTPIQWAAETDMIRYSTLPGFESPQIQLCDQWKAVYDTQALWGADLNLCVKHYLESLVWTLAYYSGAPIDTYWYYPWLLPPRSEAIVMYLKSNSLPVVPNTKQAELRCIEQLAMVLPESSFHLLPKELQNLPKLYPYAWPVKWGYYSYGRRFMWECEPLIPLIQPYQIKQWIEVAYDA